MDISISDSLKMVTDCGTGTIVHIHGIPEEQAHSVTKLAENNNIISELLSTFAPYLMAYSDVTIKYNGVIVDPTKQIKTQVEKELSYQEEGKPETKARVVAIQWKQSQFSKLYICGSSGVVYAEDEYSPLKKAAISVYIMSDQNVFGKNTEDKKCALMFYTTTSPIFEQHMSYSVDNFKTIIPYKDKTVVIPHIEGENRDPKVIFCDELNCYIMALYLVKDVYCILKSDNLVSK